MADGFDIRLSADEADRLRAIAGAVGRGPDDYAKAVLAQAIADDWVEDERRWANFDAGGSAMTLDEFMRPLRAVAETKRHA